MNIGLSTTTLEPCHTKGHIDGIGVYTSQLRESFRQTGHHVTSLAFPHKTSSAGLICSQPFPGSFARLAGLGIASAGLIRYRLPVDLIHFTDYRIFPVKCPAIATLHDAIPLKFPEMCNPDFRAAKNFVQRSIARFADHVITLSQASVPDIVEFYQLPADRISVVGCGVSNDWLIEPEPCAVEQVLDKYALKRGYFLFVGTFQPRKNVDRIIAAYRKLPAAIRSERKLVCVGRAGWRCEETVTQLQQLVAAGEAVWLNTIDEDGELRAIYTGAGVFVFPSLYEGYGIPVLEAFACGVPVITSNVSSLPEVSRQIGVELDPTSIDDLTDAMKWLATDETERRQRATAGRLLADSLSWDTVAAQTLAVYNKIL